MTKPFPAESAARLLETYDPVSVITLIMEAAKARGWANGFAVMETEAGSTATVVTKDGMSSTVLGAILLAISGTNIMEATAPEDRSREAINQMRDIADWLSAEGHGDQAVAAADLADDLFKLYPETV